MATRIKYHQLYVAPTTDESDDDSIIIPHVDSGWCQVVGADFSGGGGDKRFLLHVITFEPVAEPESAEETAESE